MLTQNVLRIWFAKKFFWLRKKLVFLYRHFEPTRPRTGILARQIWLLISEQRMRQ